MNIRTDLATEQGELKHLGEKDGFYETVTQGDIPVSRVRIVNENAAQLTGKPIGNYATIFFDGAFSDDTLFDQAVERTAEVIREFLKGAQNVLAVGLGNAEMTADALGPKVIDRLVVSRHLKDKLPDLYRQLALGNLSALRPGVLGQTGIETAEMIRAAADTVSPDAILVFDALASRRAKRLCATVQISDTGIVPGSGVGNHRAAVNREYLGVPVISVGVPTVVDAATLAVDTLEKVRDRMDEDERAMAEAWTEDEGDRLRHAMGDYENNLIVTPQDIDALIDRTAKLLATAANQAIHRNVDREQMDLLCRV